MFKQDPIQRAARRVRITQYVFLATATVLLAQQMALVIQQSGAS